MTVKGLKKHLSVAPRTERMPVFFVGHGSPMNAVENNTWSRAWEQLGKTLPRPQAILSISAHWMTEGAFVHVARQPKTIHDFYGFPKAMYDLRYPCPGDPTRAKDVQELVKATRVA